MKKTLSIDMSLRSSGVVILDRNDNLCDYQIISTTSKEFPCDEDLINHLRDSIYHLILKHPSIDRFVIEGLSLNAKSGKMDVIAGAYWGIRSLIAERFSYILIGSVPVNAWRNWATTKEERDFSKANCADWQKNVVFFKLPYDIQDLFLKYTIENKLKPTAAFDLCDAYWLAKYRNNLKE